MTLMVRLGRRLDAHQTERSGRPRSGRREKASAGQRGPAMVSRTSIEVRTLSCGRRSEQREERSDRDEGTQSHICTRQDASFESNDLTERWRKRCSVPCATLTSARRACRRPNRECRVREAGRMTGVEEQRETVACDRWAAQSH